ncbi:Mur ligase [Blastocladiella britannica]|nr:Mur ligase [Blastocladiella britannica]
MTTARSTLDLGLSRVRDALCRLAHPERAVRVVHVAGTNGKGSTSAYLAALLRRHYDRVGMFSSPHLVHPRDAWRINGTPASLAQYEAARAQVMAAMPTTTAPTSSVLTQFELDFVAMLVHLRAHNVPATVIEVGVGGREDATNVFRDTLSFTSCCTAPTTAGTVVLATVVQRVALDHVGLLGSTVPEIAAHKAGIVASSAPCLIAVQADDEALATVRAAVRAEVSAVGGNVPVRAITTVRVERRDRTVAIAAEYVDDPEQAHRVEWTAAESVEEEGNSAILYGYQHRNAAAALATYDMIAPQLPPALKGRTESALDTLLQVRIPGRLDRVTLPTETLTLVDGAHNPDGARALRAYLDATASSSSSGGITWVLAATRGKDLGEMARILVLAGDRVITTAFSPVEHMPWVQSVDPAEVVAQVQKATRAVQLVGSKDRIWEVPREWVAPTPSHPRTVVAGSMYLAADVYRWIERC